MGTVSHLLITTYRYRDYYIQHLNGLCNTMWTNHSCVTSIRTTSSSQVISENITMTNS